MFSSFTKFFKQSWVHWLVFVVGIIFGSGLAFSKTFFVPKFTADKSSTAEYYPMAKYFGNNTATAEYMHKEVRILCWVMTAPKNHKKKAQHIRNTWGKRCNILLFITTEEDPDLENTIPVNVKEGRQSLWKKNNAAFKYVHDNYRHEADWFMKADDDNYIIMENLRAFLQPYSPDMPIFFGRKFLLKSRIPSHGYMSGPGYILSGKALDLFVEKCMYNSSLCYQGTGDLEDHKTGVAMQNLGVYAGDTRDSEGRDRFFPFQLHYHLVHVQTRNHFWYFDYCYYIPIDGIEGVPSTAIAFHYIPPRILYWYEYAINTIKTYGRSSPASLFDGTKYTMKQVIKNLAVAEYDRPYMYPKNYQEEGPDVESST